MGVVAEHVVRAGPLPGERLTGGSGMPAPDLVGGGPEHAGRLLDGAERIAGLGVWSVDLEANESHFSDGLRKLCGLPNPCTIVEALDLVHPEDRAALSEFRARLVSPDEPTPVEVEVRDAAGERIFQVRGQAEFDAAGHVVRTTGTVQDVT